MIFNLYDWDDTLVLSRKALYLSYKKALSDWDIQFEYSYFNDFIYSDATKFMKNLNFSDEEIEEIKTKKEKYYLNDFFDEIIFKIPDWSDKRVNNQYYIVTNTNQSLVQEMLLKKFNTTLPFQGFIGTYDGIKRKPAPDLYEAAFSIFRHKWDSHNDELHIYEDSVEGLLSAAKFIEMYRKRIKKFKLHHVTYEDPFTNIQIT